MEAISSWRAVLLNVNARIEWVSPCKLYSCKLFTLSINNQTNRMIHRDSNSIQPQLRRILWDSFALSLPSTRVICRRTLAPLWLKLGLHACGTRRSQECPDLNDDDNDYDGGFLSLSAICSASNITWKFCAILLWVWRNSTSAVFIQHTWHESTRFDRHRDKWDHSMRNMIQYLFSRYLAYIVATLISIGVSISYSLHLYIRTSQRMSIEKREDLCLLFILCENEVGQAWKSPMW